MCRGTIPGFSSLLNEEHRGSEADRIPVVLEPRMVSRPDDDRTITAAGLALLLARLDPDTDRAALDTERLRRTLVRFFDWRGIWPPDECADETLDRLARRLEGETTVEDLRSYAYGIARMVLLERRRRPTFDPLDEAPDQRALGPTPQDEET